METVEKLLNQIEKNNIQVQNIVNENQKILLELRNRPQEDWDWVSVPVAAKKLDVSQCMIYQRINRGKLKCRKFENKIFVNLKDLVKIDDSVAN